MELRKTKNGKTCFDIRDQFQRVSYWLVIRHCMETKRLIADGVITTQEQYEKHRAEQRAKEMALFDYAYKYANSVSCGSFWI